jgi:phospholipid methyltransferase
VLPGAALHLAAKGTLRIGAEVTTSGPYRWVRHPFYLATLLVDGGICVTARSLWFAVGAMTLSVAVHLRTMAWEETALARLFGPTYDAYRSRVPQFLPWKGPARGLPPSVGFSWNNPQLAIGKEYARIVRTLAAPLLVFVGARLVVLRGSFFSEQHAPELAAATALLLLFLVELALLRRSRNLKAADRDRSSPPHP